MVSLICSYPNTLQFKHVLISYFLLCSAIYKFTAGHTDDTSSLLATLGVPHGKHGQDGW